MADPIMLRCSKLFLFGKVYLRSACHWLRGVIVHFKARELKRCFSFDCQGRGVNKLQSELNLDNIITQSA